MTFSIEKFYFRELENLAKETNLDEDIDYSCRFIVAKKDNKIIGVAGVNFIKNKTPRFEHIIISPKYQKTKLGGILMIRTEQWLRELGHTYYNAFIYYDKFLMRHYAKKFGFVETTKGNKGSWFVKDLIPKKEMVYA